MAAILFQQTDGAMDFAANAGCSGKTANSTNSSRKASSGGTAGTSAVSQSIDNSTTDVWAVVFECAVPSGATWASGNWVVRLNVTLANSSITWDQCFICRVNSSGTSQATIGSATGLAISLGSTGVKSHTISGLSQTPSSGDVVVCVLVFSSSKSHGGAAAFSYTPDQLIDSPLTQSSSVSVTATDTESFSESFSRSTTAHRTASDTDSFSDSAARSAAFSRAAADTESLSESVGENVALSRGFSDTEAFSESATGKIAASRAASDTESFSDSLVGQHGVSRTATDTEAFSESVARALALAPKFSDTLAFTDSLARLTQVARSATDSSATSDQAARSTAAARTGTDSVSFSDSLTRLLALKSVAQDTLSFSESLARVLALSRQVSDSAAFSDTLARAIALARAAVDSLAFSDTLARSLALGRSFSDTLAFSESSGEHVALLRAISDAESFSDSVTGQSSGHGANVTATDSVAFSESLARLATDSASLSDSLARLLALKPAVTDSVVFTEQLLAASSSTPRQAFTAMNWQLALREAPSDVSGDKILGEFPSPMAIELDYQLAAGQAMGVVDTFLSPQTIPNNSSWAAGSYALTLVVQNGVSVSFTVQLWRADAAGADIAQIGAQPVANVGPAVGPATFTFTITDAAGQVATATERLKLKLLAQNTDGAAAHEFSILCSLSYLKTPIIRLFEITNKQNTWRRGRFLGHFLRKGEHTMDFDKNGVDLHP